MARLKDRLSLRALLFWLAAIGLIVLTIAAIGVSFRALQVSNEAQQVVSVYEPASDDVATLSLAASEMQRGLSLYVLGGDELDLRPYVDGERRSTLALDSLERLLGTDPEVQPLLGAAQSSRQEWLDSIAGPAIKAMREGRDRAAQKLVLGDPSAELYGQLITDTDRLRHTINATLSDSFEELADLSRQLTRVVVATVAMLLLALLGAGLLLFRWVLDPLNDLRRQIRVVARRGKHQSPISPRGPREIAAVGTDAETMRRQLVSEIDEARSAREALQHRAPVVAAIRRELSMPTDRSIAGVSVHGEVRAAEGVLAGDWWDCVAMPSGEAALIITDIAGHGPEAGIAAMRIKHLMALMLASGAEPEEALAIAARSFADEVGRFATTAVVCVDPRTGGVRWANGGHHAPVILRVGGNDEPLDPTGPLLSWLGGPWSSRTTRMAAGDVLLAFSDGLLESKSEEGDQLEVTGLLEIYRREAGEDGNVPTDETVRRTLARARDRAVDWERDDVTLVALALAPGDRAASAPPPGSIPRPQPEGFGATRA